MDWPRMDIRYGFARAREWGREHSVFLVAAVSFCVGCVFTIVGWGLFKRWSNVVILKNEYTVTEVATSIQAVAITAGLASIWLMWRQSRENNRWNKLVIYHQHFDDLPSADLGRRAHEVVRHFVAGLTPPATIFGENVPDLDHSTNDALTEDQRQKLSVSYFMGLGTPLDATVSAEMLSHAPSARVIRQYLDAFELLCGAVNCGVLSDAYARELEFTRVCRAQAMFQQFILLVRAKGNTQAYVELEAVSDRWQEFKEKQYDETQKKSNHLEAAKKKLNRSVGVPREF